MGVVVTMVMYRFHEVEPALKYLLISIGSSLVLVISLLMCGKGKGKKTDSNKEKSKDPAPEFIHTEPPPPQPVEEIVIAIGESTVESTPPDIDEYRARKGTAPTTPILPNTKEPLRKTLSSINQITTDTSHDNNTENLCNDSANPYDTVKKKEVTPVFEYSGNSDSGNSIYARVKDVPLREETAYAVVDIKDKDYDFVNGKVVRRTVEESEETDDTIPEYPCHYDKPNSNASVKINDETENSGGSGIYECVSDSKNFTSSTGPSLTSGGPPLTSGGPPLTSGGSPSNSTFPPLYRVEVSLPHVSADVDKTDTVTPSNDNSAKSNSLNRQLNPQNECIRKAGSKEKIFGSRERLDDIDKNEKQEDHDKLSRLSRYLKFTHSKKSKKTEELNEVEISTQLSSKEIHSNNVDSNEDSNAPPPLPSVIKLRHIADQNKGQHPISDRGHSPEPSGSGSSPTSTNSITTNPLIYPYEERLTNLDTGVTTNTLGEPYVPHHRPRMSEGNGLPYGEPYVPHHRPRRSEGNILPNDLNLPNDTVLKTQYSLPMGGNTQVVSDTTINDENNIHLVLSKSINTHINPSGDITRGSIISEPDYAEIESRTDNRTRLSPSNGPTIVYEPSNDNTTKGYTEIDYGVRHHELHGGIDGGDGGGSTSYAVVDFNKKSEDRRIKDLYAAVDYNTKKLRTEEEVVTSLPVRYEGPYDIIPDVNPGEVVIQEGIYEEVSVQRN